MLNYTNFVINESKNDISIWQNTTRKVLKQLGLDFGFMVKWGTSISALYPIVDKLIKNDSVTIGTSDVVLLTICAVAILLQESNEKIQKLKLVLEEKKLNGLLPKIVDFLKMNFNIFKVLCSKIGKTIISFYDIFSYTVLYVPFLSVLLELIVHKNLSLESFGKYAIATSVGLFLVYAKHFITELYDKFKSKIKRNESLMEGLVIEEEPNFNLYFITESVENRNHAILLKTGEQFWIGAVNVLDGEIEEVYTYEKAESNDFHHSFYFSDSMCEKIKDEECMVFWVDEDGINGEWTHGVIPDKIEEQIKQQIKFVD